MPRNPLILPLLLVALPAAAQDFTTAAEVKPILTATKPAWIAVRDWEGQDLLYFTNLLAWRCGVTAIHWGTNGAAAETLLQAEPCYEGEPQPNALKMDGGVMPFVTLPSGSIQTVTVTVTFDDGSTETGSYERAAVMTP